MFLFLILLFAASGCSNNLLSSQTSGSTKVPSSTIRLVGAAYFPSDIRGANLYPLLWLNDNQGIVAVHGPGHLAPGRTEFDLGTSKQLTVPGLAPTNYGELLTASPNGKWVLWCEYIRGSGKWSVFVTRLSDGKTIKLPEQTNRLAVCWLRDNRHIVLVDDVDAGIDQYTGRHYYVPGITILDTLTRSVVNKKVQGITDDIQIVREDVSGDLIMSGYPSWPCSTLSSVTLYRLNLHAKILNVNFLNVPVPTVPGSQDFCFIVAPNADRIIWHFTSYSWAFMFMNFRHGPLSIYDDFYVTNLDGSGVRKIGHLSNGGTFGTMAVSPDGDKIAIQLNQNAAIINFPSTLPATSSRPDWTPRPGIL